MILCRLGNDYKYILKFENKKRITVKNKRWNMIVNYDYSLLVHPLCRTSIIFSNLFSILFLYPESYYTV
jgi:hypothetical protein